MTKYWLVDGAQSFLFPKMMFIVVGKFDGDELLFCCWPSYLVSILTRSWSHPSSGGGGSRSCRVRSFAFLFLVVLSLWWWRCTSVLVRTRMILTTDTYNTSVCRQLWNDRLKQTLYSMKIKRSNEPYGIITVRVTGSRSTSRSTTTTTRDSL